MQIYKNVVSSFADCNLFKGLLIFKLFRMTQGDSLVNENRPRSFVHDSDVTYYVP